MESSRGQPPLDNSISSPHPHELEAACVLNTITEILAATGSAEIIQRDERGNLYLPTAMLDRVFALSGSLLEEVVSLLPPTFPPLQKPLIKSIIYGLILDDIQRILSSSDPVEISDDIIIDRRRDDFLLQLKDALDLFTSSKVPTDQRGTPNSNHFFQNSHHNVIYGGNFIANSTSNPVVHDPVVREQSHKILQLIYIQCVILFA